MLLGHKYKLSRINSVICGLMLSVQVFAAEEFDTIDLTALLPQSLLQQNAQHSALPATAAACDLETSNPAADPDSLANHETLLPYTAKQHVPRAQRRLLEQYLRAPDAPAASAALATYHFAKGKLKGQRNAGAQLEHNIYALYFLSRLQDLGVENRVLTQAKRQVEARLNKIEAPHLAPMIEERRASHLSFIEAFNHDESQRYTVVDQLLRDYAQQPNNVATTAYLAASTIWLGGEAPYDDATILNHFILSSYFSVKAVAMSQILEQRWLADPANNQQFRLAPLLGGWVVPARRWLAEIHNDQAALASLDEEHRLWLAHNPAFHSASVGIVLFDQGDQFWEGLDAWIQGLVICEQQFEIKACDDRPKFSFNRLSFLLGAVDYFVKAGDLATAQEFLQYRMAPFFMFEQWDLGRDEWLLRETRLDDFHNLYHNEDPADDPTHFLAKSHQWGPDTIACQVCHRTQSREWSAEQIEQYELEPPHSSIATLYDWPAITTTWYGSSIQANSVTAP